MKAARIGFRPVEGTVPWHKEVTKSSWVKPDWNIDYFVPNFGVDEDIKSSITHMDAAEKSTGKKMVASFKKPKGHPVDYFVPNFGEDNDIKLT